MENQNLETIAEHSLGIVEHISKKAMQDLGFTEYGPDVQHSNITDNIINEIQGSIDAVRRDNGVLALRPTFMRVDLEDIDGNKEGDFYTYNNKNGFSNGKTWSIIEDKNGIIWLSSSSSSIFPCWQSFNIAIAVNVFETEAI